MTTIDIDGSDLIVRVQGLDRLWTLNSELRVPLAHVSGIEPAAAEAHRLFHGLRIGGTNVPGVLTAGTFWEREGHVFWDVHDADRAVAIRLHDDRFVRLVLEVADPAATIETVAAAIAPAASA